MQWHSLFCEKKKKSFTEWNLLKFITFSTKSLQTTSFLLRRARDSGGDRKGIRLEVLQFLRKKTTLLVDMRIWASNGELHERSKVDR